ncbi:hypothetical protein OH77DRAFT_1422167 [Trametes cingulata]|nr:hypothetical protein OH77DRAFT_1422167 [Trametes cingulata]
MSRSAVRADSPVLVRFNGNPPPCAAGYSRSRWMQVCIRAAGPSRFLPAETRLLKPVQVNSRPFDTPLPAMFKAIVALTALAATAVAQQVIIAAPPAQATLFPGESVVVDIDRVPSLTGSQDVAVAIGIQTCVGRTPSGTCDGVDTGGDIGTPLFSGPYNPQPVGHGHSDLFQNYTVTIPDFLPAGPAVLTVAHFGLVIGELAFLEIVNQTVVIGSGSA